MSESPAPRLPQDSPHRSDAPAVDTASLEQALAAFRQWFVEASTPEGPPPVPASSRVDLTTLMNLFVGLRQEVHLHTRAVRTHQEQTALLIDQLTRADHRPTSGAGNPEEALRAMVLTLIETHDALGLAAREIERIEANTGITPISTPGRSRTLWNRLVTAIAGQRSGSDSIVEALVEGYRLSLDRLERILVLQGIERIQTQGLRYDPEVMEVLEAVGNTGLPGGTVLDEIRRGYRWHGRLLRSALVRVARS